MNECRCFTIQYEIIAIITCTIITLLHYIDINAHYAIIQSYKQIIQIRIYMYGLNRKGV